MRLDIKYAVHNCIKTKIKKKTFFLFFHIRFTFPRLHFRFYPWILYACIFPNCYLYNYSRYINKRNKIDRKKIGKNEKTRGALHALCCMQSFSTSVVKFDDIFFCRQFSQDEVMFDFYDFDKTRFVTKFIFSLTWYFPSKSELLTFKHTRWTRIV